jgi:hypothetical protein
VTTKPTRAQRARDAWARTDPAVRAEWQRKGRNAYYATHPDRRPAGWTPEPGPELEASTTGPIRPSGPRDLAFIAGGLWWVIRR